MVRGNELSHHWTYGEVYQAPAPPRFNRGRDEGKKKPKEKKEKKKNPFRRLIEWIAAGAEGQVLGCGQCSSCKPIKPREKDAR